MSKFRLFLAAAAMLVCFDIPGCWTNSVKLSQGTELMSIRLNRDLVDTIISKFCTSFRIDDFNITKQ